MQSTTHAEALDDNGKPLATAETLLKNRAPHSDVFPDRLVPLVLAVEELARLIEPGYRDRHGPGVEIDIVLAQIQLSQAIQSLAG